MPETLIRRDFVRTGNGDFICWHCTTQNGYSARYASQAAVICHVENSCYWVL